MNIDDLQHMLFQETPWAGAQDLWKTTFGRTSDGRRDQCGHRVGCHGQKEGEPQAVELDQFQVRRGEAYRYLYTLGGEFETSQRMAREREISEDIGRHDFWGHYFRVASLGDSYHKI